MAKINQLKLKSGKIDSIVTSEITEVAPLYAINSTAYAVQISWKLEDCTHKGITVCFRKHGNPIPSNVEDIKARLRKNGMYDPHWSMQWIRRAIETPCPGKSNYTDDNVEGMTI